MEGDKCDVSAQCQAGLLCSSSKCTKPACTTNADCSGGVGGCGSFACIQGACVAACQPDAGSTDAQPSPDLGASDLGVDSGTTDGVVLTDSGTPPDGGVPPDGGMPADSGVPPDSGAASDSGPDSGCDPTARTPALGDLMINEFMADPPAGIAGDANQDGIRNAGDRFIEIANISSHTVQLGGVVVSNSTGVRHLFATTPLACGKVIVVFSGGDPTNPNWMSNWVAASNGTLALIKTGDTINVGTSIATPNDLIVYTYGNEAAIGEALNRAADLIPTAGFMPEDQVTGSGGRLYSPGTRVDGTPF
jgi:hypothetical protein